ncbi:MAG: hypothetical protein AB7P76_07520 [Candidatus Melainabacteria bacterium]
MQTLEIYTLKGLAEKEGASYDHMRHLALRASRGEGNIWRGYKLVKPGNRTWLAYPEHQNVTFYDGD